MQTFTAIVRNRVGLHARPAAVFVKTASRFKSTITVRNASGGPGGTAGPLAPEPVNAKSILLVLGLGVEEGHAIEVMASGPDEVEAAAALQEIIEHGGAGAG
jgi:phosphotransferase system HPr (HPr) family protein